MILYLIDNFATKKFFINFKQIEIFKGFSDYELEKFAEVVSEVKIKKGEILFKEDEPGDSLYIIQSGSMTIFKTIDKEKGIEKSLSILVSGDCVGEMSLLDGTPRTASVRADEDTTLLKISRNEFNILIAKYPQAGTRLMRAFTKIISQRLSQTNQELVVLYEMGKIISTIRRLKEMAKAIVDRMIFYLDINFASVSLINDITGYIELIYASGEGTNKLLGLTHSPKEGLWGYVLQKGETIKIDDFDTDERFKNLKKFGYERKRMIISPLLKEKKIIGFLSVGDKKDGSIFTGSNINLVNGIASQSAPAIEIAKVYEEQKAKESFERKYIQF